MKPIVVITHAVFSEARRCSLALLLDALKPHGLDHVVWEDCEQRGPLWCWDRAMRFGLSRSDCSHVVWLPDDAILCPNFGELLRGAIEARPSEVFDCYANCDRAPTIASAWYTTSEGYVGLGGCMPRGLLMEHLAWRDEHLDDRSGNDEGVNLWAMATGRLIWKTTRSLVSHRAELPSLAGTGHHMYRTPATFSDGRAEDWTAEPVHVGRSYVKNHWGLMTKVRPPMTARAYEVEKDAPR